MKMTSVSTLGFCFLASGCVTQPIPFDVPYEDGIPLVRTITQRIRCELRMLVQDIEPLYPRRRTLLEYDYNVSMFLSIDASGSAGLAPSLSFSPIGFSFGFTPSIKYTRQDQSGYRLSYSLRDIYDDWKKRPDRYKCPDPDTLLAGDLGIYGKVSSAIMLEDIAYTTDVSPDGGMFNGNINFTIARGVDQLGPTWTLTHFSGPGPLLSASWLSNNKLSFGFAGGKRSNKPYIITPASRLNNAAAADRSLGQAINNDIAVQLNAIRSILR